MFTAQDTVDNNITLFFPSECEWCSLYQSDLFTAFIPTKSCSFHFLSAKMGIVPPYLNFYDREAGSDPIVEAHIFYKDKVLDMDLQFLFDSNLGIPFMSALEDLWQRNFIETNNLKQEKTSD